MLVCMYVYMCESVRVCVQIHAFQPDFIVSNYWTATREKFSFNSAEFTVIKLYVTVTNCMLQ